MVKKATKYATKSAAIREVLAANPKAGVDAIKVELGKLKVKASDALINKLKYGKPKASKPASKPATRNGQVNLETLRAAKELVGKAGGIEQAKDALAGLAELIS